MLGVLLPPFEKKCGCQVDVIAVGTGKALKLGEAGDVDAVLVHARALEDRFVADGFGVNRRDVMYNDFVIIGPERDPADIRHAKTAADAFKRIALAQLPFISRGDESGTHEKELEIWRTAGINPQGRWYRSVGQGMGEAIIMATEMRGYTISDRGTYIVFKHGKTDLKILFEGEGYARFRALPLRSVGRSERPCIRTGVSKGGSVSAPMVGIGLGGCAPRTGREKERGGFRG